MELYSLKISRTRTVVDYWYPALFCKVAEGGNQGPAESGHLLMVHSSFCSLCWGLPLPLQEGMVRTGGLNSFRDNVLLKVSVVRNYMHTKKKGEKKEGWLAAPTTRSPSPQNNPVHLPYTGTMYIHIRFPKTDWYYQHYLTHHSSTHIFGKQDEVQLWNFEQGQK